MLERMDGEKKPEKANAELCGLIGSLLRKEISEEEYDRASDGLAEVDFDRLAADLRRIKWATRIEDIKKNLANLLKITPKTDKSQR
jgi:hypothetical protein